MSVAGYAGTRPAGTGERLRNESGRRRGRTTKMSSRSFTKVHLTAYPSFSYFPSELRPSMSASRTRELTGEVEDAAVCDAAGVKERDQRTTPPAENIASTLTSSVLLPRTHPCAI